MLKKMKIPFHLELFTPTGSHSWNEALAEHECLLHLLK